MYTEEQKSELQAETQLCDPYKSKPEYRSFHRSLMWAHTGGKNAFKALPASERLALVEAEFAKLDVARQTRDAEAAERRNAATKDGRCKACGAIVQWLCRRCGRCVACENGGKPPKQYLCGSSCLGGCGRCPDCSGHGCTCFEHERTARAVDVKKAPPLIKRAIMCSVDCVRNEPTTIYVSPQVRRNNEPLVTCANVSPR